MNPYVQLERMTEFLRQRIDRENISTEERQKLYEMLEDLNKFARSILDILEVSEQLKF